MKFKNTFGVTGTPAQLEAFREWAESVGWKTSIAGLKKYDNMLWFNGDEPSKWRDECEDINGECWGVLKNGCHNIEETETTYTLPDQWTEAMQAAQEMVYEIGDWVTVVSNDQVEDVMWCNDQDYYHKGMVGMVTNIEPSGLYKGTYWVRLNNHCVAITANQLRPATPEEIAASSPPQKGKLYRCKKTDPIHGGNIVVLCTGHGETNERFAGVVLNDNPVIKGCHSNSLIKADYEKIEEKFIV